MYATSNDCLKCGKGFGVAGKKKDWDKDGYCEKCVEANKEWNANVDLSPCIKHRPCPAGQGYEWRNRIKNACIPCSTGKFSDKEDYLPCQPVTDCAKQGKVEKTAASAKNDTICGPLRQCTCEHGTAAQGLICPKDGDKKCMSCDQGYYFQLASQNCVQVKNCSELGLTVKTSETPNSDAVCGAEKVCKCDNGKGTKGKDCSKHGESQCLSCNGGFYLSKGSCIKHTDCSEKKMWMEKAGTSTSDAVCISCKHGKAISEDKRTKPHECGECDPGYALRNGFCEAYEGNCKNGDLIELKLRTSDDHCGYCLSGYGLNKKDKTCEPWGGTCLNGNLSEQWARIQANDCGSCDAGYELTASKGEGPKTCQACPKGTFNGDVSEKPCQVCPNGRYLINAKGASVQDACKECEEGTFCKDGEKKVCADGEWSGLGATECGKCGQGYACKNGTKKECVAGTYALGGSSECKSCKDPQWSAVRSHFCFFCKSGYGVNLGDGSYCAECTEKDRSYSTEVNAKPCGQHAPCGPGTGYKYVNDKDACITCGTGFFSSTTDYQPCLSKTHPTKDKCQDGYKFTLGSNKEDSSCEKCDNNTVGVMEWTGENNCTIKSCAPGYHNNSGDSDKCVPYGGSCRNGKLREIAKRRFDNDCASCNAGFFLTTGKDKKPLCQACPSGSYAKAGTEGACIVCDAGTYLVDATAVRKPCASCPQSYACTNGKKTKCEGTTYANGTGNKTCSSCPAAFFCKNGIKKVCYEGYYSAKDASECTECEEGRACSKGVQRICPDGMWTKSKGASQCDTKCPSGYFCKDGNKIACAAGTYAPKGSTECKSCTYPQWSSIKSANCSLCKAGFGVNETGAGPLEANYCVACNEANTSWNLATDESPCGLHEKCGKGMEYKYVNQRDACFECKKGFFSSTVDYGACKPMKQADACDYGTKYYPAKTSKEDALCSPCSSCVTVKEAMQRSRGGPIPEDINVCRVAKWKTRGTCEIEACQRFFKVDSTNHECVHCHRMTQNPTWSNCAQCFDEITTSNTAKNTLLFDARCNPTKCKPGYELRDFEGENLLNLQLGQKRGFGLGWKKICVPFGGTCKNGYLIEQEKRTKDGHCGSCKSYELKGDQCVLKGEKKKEEVDGLKKEEVDGSSPRKEGEAQLVEEDIKNRRRHLIETPQLEDRSVEKVSVFNFVNFVCLVVGSIIGAMVVVLYQKHTYCDSNEGKEKIEMVETIPEIIVQ
eukprot:g5719.t1